MGMQRFYAGERFAFANGAIGWRPGGPFDCLGPYAKVERCPVHVFVPDEEQRRWNKYAGTFSDTGITRTVYATGYADTFFSVPAVCKVHGRRVTGFLTMNDGACVFNAHSWERE